MFRWIWHRPKKQPTTGSAEVDRWYKELREAAEAASHPTADRLQRAELVLEMLDARERIGPGLAAATHHEPMDAEICDASTATDQQVPLPSPRTGPAGESKGSVKPTSASPGFLAKGGRAHVVVLLGAIVGVITTLTASVGYVALPKASDEGTTGGSLPAAQLVRSTTLRVGVLPVVDVAPFYRALDAGYFAEAGVEIELVVTPSGPQAIEDLAAGRLDIAFTSYPGILKAQSARHANLKIIAPAYTARPGHLMLVAPPNGDIQKAEDVAGKRIGITSRGSISDLGVMAELQASGVDPSNIQWVPMPMPDMGPALERGDIDGAVLAEPYVTLTDHTFHARPILDVAVGKTARIPMTGWAASSTIGETSGHAAEAFVRALDRGRGDVADRAVLDPILVKHLGVDTQTAKDVNVADFTAHLDAAEIQRVADLMKSFNVIEQPLDVRPMLLSP